MVKTNIIYLVVIVFCWLFVSCKETGKSKGQSTLSENTKVKPVFELPIIPMVYTTDKSRNDFLAIHYWDRFDFEDTVLFKHNDEVEQAFANYLQVLNWVTPEIVTVSVDSLLGKAWWADCRNGGTKAYDYFTGQLEHYLYEPDSPMRNDEQYLIVLKRILNLSGPEPILKIRPTYQYKGLMINRVGTPATHISFYLHSGQAGSLYQLKTNYVLLFFYDPDCPACQQMVPKLSESAVIQEMLRMKKLTLLALYADKNVDLWRKHIQEMPREWIHAYDKKGEILNEGKYNLRALPQLYLLDKNKNVIIKDGTFEQVENTLIQAKEKNIESAQK